MFRGMLLTPHVCLYLWSSVISRGLCIYLYLYLLLNSCKVQVHEGEDAKEKGNEGKSRGFGFVNFEEHDSAVNAIEAFNGTVSSSGFFAFASLLC